MSDCYESMSRTPIRDRPLQQPLIRHSRHPFVNPAPRLVIPAKAGIQRGGGRQDRRQSSYESMSRTPIRDRPLRQPLIRHSRHPFVIPAPQSSFRRRPESRGAGGGKIAASLRTKACPGLRSGIDRSGSLSFAIRGIPSSIRPLDSSFPRKRESRGARGDKTAASLRTKACPGLRSRMNVCRHDRWSRYAGVRWNPLALVIPAPQIVIPAKAGIQRGGVGCGNDARTLPPTNASNFHAFVCRRQPACAIAMKACPGLRSGIDCSSSLSFAIRGIPSSIRPLDSSFRPPKSSFPRKRESRGEVWVVAMTLELSHQPMHPIFMPSCAGDSRHE